MTATRRALLKTKPSDDGIPIDIEARPNPAGDLVVMGWDDPAIVVRVGPDDFAGEPRFKEAT